MAGMPNVEHPKEQRSRPSKPRKRTSDQSLKAYGVRVRSKNDQLSTSGCLPNQARSSLKDITNWLDWDQRFKIKAFTYGLWNKINGEEEFLEEPVRPNYEDFLPEEPTDTDPQMQTRSEILVRTGTGGVELSTSDGFARAVIIHQDSMDQYVEKKEAFEKEREEIIRLKDWMQETVSNHCVRTSCKPEELITEWYKKLEASSG